MTEVEFNVRLPVNGSILKQNVGKHVSVTGTVLSTNPNGASFELRTVDNHIVTISLHEPLSEPVSGLVEVHGVANSKHRSSAMITLYFQKNFENTFDGEILNDTIVILNNVQNPWQP